jgi:hypothetical protein
MKKQIFFLFFLLIPGVLSVGISPSSITMDDVYLNEEMQNYFFLVSHEKPTNFNLRSDCIEIKVPQKVEVSGTKKVEFLVNIKEEPAFGLTCSIFVEEEKNTDQISVSNTMQLIVMLNTTKDKNPLLEIYNVEALPTEIGQESIIFVGIENKGNVQLNPELEFNIGLNKSVESFGKIRSKERIQKIFKIKTDKIGVYKSNVTLKENDHIFDNKFFTLEVFSPDVSYGNVIIENVSVTKGELTKIDLKIKNNSPVPVKARSYIEIYKNGELINVIESNETQIFEEETLSSYIKLKRGSYRFDSRIFYNQKKSSIYSQEFFIGKEVTMTGFFVNTVGAGNLIFVGVLLVVLLVGFLIKKRKLVIKKIRKILRKVYK